MTTRPKTRRRQSQKSEMSELLYQLASNCKDPARFVELFYWSQECELAELMRGLAGMSSDARHALLAFMQLAEGSLPSVVASVNSKGDFVLSSPTVSELLAPAPKQEPSEHAQSFH